MRTLGNKELPFGFRPAHTAIVLALGYCLQGQGFLQSCSFWALAVGELYHGDSFTLILTSRQTSWKEMDFTAL